MMTGTISRRRLIGAVGATGAVAALAGAATACSAPEKESPQKGEAVSRPLPTFRRYEGAAPDLPGDGGAVPDGFLSYPKGVRPVVTEPPGDGSKVTATTVWLGTPPLPLGQNAYWQELNRRLGVELEYQSSPEDGYVGKVATLLAGGDLPDLLQIPLEITRLPSVLEARFADLTDHVSGDAILDYPFLANQPTRCWQQGSYDGRIWGLRMPLHPYGSFMFANRGVLSGLGVDVADVTDGESFADLCREVTAPNAKRWALGNPNWTLNFITEMLGKPHFTQLHWHQTGGKFTYARETDEYLHALEYLLGLWKGGVFHPDSIADGNSSKAFTAEQVLLDYRGGNQWPGRALVGDVTVIPPVAFAGGGELGAKALSWGTWRLTALKATQDPERIRMLLRVMNWLAAPFGTEEYLFRQYGIEGVHHNRDQAGDPVLTEAGEAQTRLPNTYLAAPPPVTYAPGQQDVTREWHAFNTRIGAVGVMDAALGLWSDTADQKWARLERQLEDTINGIFRGSGNLADYHTALEEWRRNGGDQIRGEYEAAYAKANG